MSLAALGWTLFRRGRRTVRVAATVLGLCELAGPTTSAQSVTIDCVTVGDAGNAADTTGYGDVNYAYRIGTYAVTIGQYTEFLNAVAATDV